MLRSSPETMQCMLQFAKSSQYIRLDGNNSVEAVNLQDHDTSFTFDVHVYEAVSMKDGRSMQQLYRFSCGDITLCGSPDGRRLILEELGSQVMRHVDYVTTDDVWYFRGVEVGDCKTFESVWLAGRYIACDGVGRVVLKETSSADTETHFHLKQL